MLRGQHVGEFSNGDDAQTLGFDPTSLAMLACDSWSILWLQGDDIRGGFFFVEGGECSN